jgi:hypothetical protein
MNETRFRASNFVHSLTFSLLENIPETSIICPDFLEGFKTFRLFYVTAFSGMFCVVPELYVGL